MAYDIIHSFPGKERDEAVFVFARPYPVAFLPTALLFLVVFVSSLLVQAAISFGWIPVASAATANAFILFTGIFQLFALIVFLIAIFDFYNDILIVTDRRLVDIDQEQLFSRPISELHLEDVQDVTSNTRGFFQTMFNFGNVTIQTAGERTNFEAVNFQHPREIASIISDLAQQAKAEIPQNKRLPETTVMGVINNTPVTTFEELKTMGAVTVDDPRRIP